MGQALADVHFVLPSPAQTMGEGEPEPEQPGESISEGRLIYTHRLVLARCSPYFEQMFIGQLALTGPFPVEVPLPQWATRPAALMLLSHLYSGGDLDESPAAAPLGKSDT